MRSKANALLARNAFHLGIAQIASTALGILLSSVLGRSLGPADFGTLYLIITTSAFVGVIIEWGQNTFMIREMARGRSDESVLIGSALLFRLATTACACALAVTLVFVLGYDKYIVALTLLAIVVALPAILYEPLGFTFRGKDRMDIDALSNIFGKTALLVATFVALHLGGGLMEVILMQGVGGLATLVIGILFARRLSLKAKAAEPKVLRELLWHGAPIAAFTFVITSQPFVEIIMLSAFAGPTVVGWYGASRTIFGIAISPATIAIGASFPELSRASRSLPDLRRTIETAGRVLFIAAAFTSSALFLFADHVVSIIYGHGRFEQTPAILRVSAVFIPLIFFVSFLGAAMNAVGRTKAMFVISVFRIMSCAVMNWFLIDIWQQRFGNGAIILVIIAGVVEIPALIAYLALLPRGAVGKATTINLMRAYITAICTVLPISLLQPLALWYLAPLFALSFAIVALTTRLVLPSDVRTAIDLARGSIFAGPSTKP